MAFIEREILIKFKEFVDVTLAVDEAIAVAVRLLHHLVQLPISRYRYGLAKTKKWELYPVLFCGNISSIWIFNFSLVWKYGRKW